MIGRVCDLEDCEGKHYAKGFCYKHYARVWRHGSIERKPTPKGELHANYKQFKDVKFPIKPTSDKRPKINELDN